MASLKASGSRLQPLSIEQQEHVIQQRMQVDERALLRLFKKLTSVLSAEDAASLSIARLSFLEELEALQHGLNRMTTVAQSTSQVEIGAYQRELGEIQSQQDTTRSRIEELKRKLGEVQRDRKNKLEYDVVAAEIIQLPTRSELVTSLDKLNEQLERIQSENVAYSSLSKQALKRMTEIVTNVEALHTDVGYEVGEQEKREVERGEAEADNEQTELTSQPDESEEGEHGPTTPSAHGSRTPRTVDAEASTALNPAAPAFQPESDSKRARPKRDATAVSASDEEGELQDTSSNSKTRSSPSKNNNDDTPRKRQKNQE